MKLKSTLFRTLLPCLAVLTLGACAQSTVKEVDYAPLIEVPPEASPSPVNFKSFRFLLPPGTEIGFEGASGPLTIGNFCTTKNRPISRNALNRQFEKQYIDLAFENALESQGYDVTNDITLEFDRDDATQRAEYFISAKITDVQLNLCHTNASILNSSNGSKGQFYINVEWSIYDALQRKTVYKTTTEGYARRDYPNSETLELLFTDAFEMASHNLGTDQGFYDLIVLNETPSAAANLHHERNIDDDYPRNFNPNEDVTIPNLARSSTPFKTIAGEANKVTVLVQKNGHGSGFFITKQGHIITNYHVVGDARRIRIVTGFRKTGITAEVLRVDRARDVALLKLDNIPEWLNLNTIKLRPIRTEWPNVGEDVYAIGVPKDWRNFRNTLTKGIVSGHRKYKRDNIVRNNFIQADVEVHPGSSGGPLVDEYGNLVGITVQGLTNSDNNPSGIGLNLFIPIQEALDALNISYEGDE